MKRRWVLAVIVLVPACTQLLGAHDPIELFGDAAPPLDATTIDATTADATTEDATDAFVAEDHVVLDTYVPETFSGSDSGRECPDGSHLCAIGCLSSTSPDSCGTSCVPCTVPMLGMPTCDAGQCDFVCYAGYGKCGLPGMPVCLDFTSDPMNCGMCMRSCDGGVCSGGECVDAG
jgi:hypothetical protein